MICPAPRTGDDVIHLHISYPEIFFAARATLILLKIQILLVLDVVIRNDFSHIRPPGNIRSVHTPEKQTQFVMHTRLHQISSFWGYVYTNPPPSAFFRRDTSCRTTTEWIKYNIVLVR